MVTEKGQTETKTIPTPDVIRSGDFLEGTTHILSLLNTAISQTPVTSAETLVNNLNLALKSDRAFGERYPQVGIIEPGKRGRKITWVPRKSQTP